jgi:hypothetical protein
MATLAPRPQTVREIQISAICHLGKDGLLKLIEKLDVSEAVISPAKLRAIIAEDTDEETARNIQRFLIGVATTVRRGFATAPDLLDNIFRSSVSDRDESSLLAQWLECRPSIERLLTSKSIVLSAKAADLASDFERFCVASRILTDIRPVLDTEHEVVVGATITHTLRLEYLSHDRTRGNISIALDMGDIERLKTACEEAVKKTNAVQVLIKENCAHIEIVLPGEEGK